VLAAFHRAYQSAIDATLMMLPLRRLSISRPVVAEKRNAPVKFDLKHHVPFFERNALDGLVPRSHPVVYQDVDLAVGLDCSVD